MSQKTKAEVLTKLRRQYARAGLPYKRQLLDQASALFGYHRKAAIRALRAQPPPPRTAAVLLGRPREYDPQALLPVLKPIGLAALQPCGSRLAALLPEWLPAYEQDSSPPGSRSAGLCAGGQRAHLRPAAGSACA